ncbi:MAG: tetratricopeptide repeat protein [bacterium]
MLNFLALLVLQLEFAMALDLNALWDFSNPEFSEQRFKAARENATGDDFLILSTQLARTYSLRKDYETARGVLSDIEQKMNAASPEAQVRYKLELGRTYVSAAHSGEPLDAQDVERARVLYLEEYEAAKAAILDALAIDALHMMAFVDTEPAAQLHWAEEALALARASNSKDARKWEASLLNNAGMALHSLNRYEEALLQFEKALELRKQESNAWTTHVAYWMVAWTLRSLDRTEEAIEIQTRLAHEREIAGEPDAFVFEELEILYRTIGDVERANHYSEKRKQLSR